MMFAYELTCGNCNVPVDFTFDDAKDCTLRTPEEVNALVRYEAGRSVKGVHAVTDRDLIQGVAYSTCPRCCHPAIIFYEAQRKGHEAVKAIMKGDRGMLKEHQRLIAVTKHYPAPQLPMQDPLWPDSLRRKFADAQRLLNQPVSPSIVLTTCGTVLELALKELERELGAEREEQAPKSKRKKQKSIYERVENVHAEAIITSPMKDWAHALRLDRTNAVHDGEGTKQEAEEYIEFLKLFLNMVFSLPRRIAEKRLPESQRNQTSPK